jgi:hypothetical protein
MFFVSLWVLAGGVGKYVNFLRAPDEMENLGGRKRFRVRMSVHCREQHKQRNRRSAYRV